MGPSVLQSKSSDELGLDEFGQPLSSLRHPTLPPVVVRGGPFCGGIVVRVHVEGDEHFRPLFVGGRRAFADRGAGVRESKEEGVGASAVQLLDEL